MPKNVYSRIKSAYRLHEKFHTGEPPFVCQTCQKSVTLENDLIKHEVVHTGERSLSVRYVINYLLIHQVLLTMKLFTQESVHLSVRRVTKTLLGQQI